MKLKSIAVAVGLCVASLSTGLSAAYASDKTIYLTFDDGPIDATLGLLDALKDANIKATFFINAFHMYGEGDENEALAAVALQRLLDDGHILANHSYDHMLHNCTDGVQSGAAYCNQVGLWPVKSYQDAATDFTYFVTNTAKVVELIPNAVSYPNNKMTKLARLPYTNGWRVTSKLKGDGLCATSDTVPPWDPAFACTAETSTNSSQVAVQIQNMLAESDYKIFGWDLDWGPEDWGVAFPAESMADGVELVAKVNQVINTCAGTTMNPLNSRTQNLDCSDGLHNGKVVILTHDFLFENAHRGQGATINLPKIKRFVEEAQRQGYRFDTLDNYAPAWQDQHSYQLPEFVSYQDKIYSLVQAHFSQSNWQPSQTPALWKNEK